MQTKRNNEWVKFSVVSVGMLGLLPALGSAAINLDAKNAVTGTATISAAADQQVNILATASGTDATAGILGEDIFLEIDNGGVDNGEATNPTAPVITDLDLSTGIFNGGSGNNGQFITGDGLIAVDSTDTGSDSVVQVPANSVLGTITFDASGLTPGTTFTLNFEDLNSAFGEEASDYTENYTDPGTPSAQFFANYPNDSITLTVAAVPEPTSTLLLTTLGGSILLLRRTRTVAR
jgi:hypothetical protein